MDLNKVIEHILDPSKTIILINSYYKEKELTLREKKLEDMKYLSDKYRDKYASYIIYALLVLLVVTVNAVLQGISLYFKYPILILISLGIPFMVYLIGVIFLLYSRYLDRKISSLRREENK